MWLKLTQMPNNEPIRINSDNVEAYGPSDENGASSYLNTNDGSYQVKEEMSVIDRALDIDAAKGWK